MHVSAAVWSGAAVAAGAVTGEPALGALLAAATVAVAVVGSVRATAVTAVLTTAAAVGLGFAGTSVLAPALVAVGVAAGGAVAVWVAVTRADDEAALAELQAATERERSERHGMEVRTRLYRLAAALGECVSVADVADTAFETLRVETGADAGLLGMVQGEGPDAVVHLLRAFGYRHDLLERRPTALLPPDMAATAAMRGGEPVFAEVAGAFAEQWPAVGGAVLADGFASLCVLPLLVSSRAVGFLAASWRARRPFPEDDRRFLVALAGQCAQALERARLADQERRARRQLTFLGDVTRLLTSSLEPTAVLAQLVDLVVGSMADACAVVAPAEGTLRRRAMAGRSRGSVAAASAAAQTGAAGVVDAVWAGQQAVQTAAPGALHVTAVPLSAGGERLGVMLFVSGGEVPAFDTDDLVLAHEVAVRASTALANATRFERERDTAAALQRAVLPDRLPEVDGVALDAVYRAGTAGTQVGGDWFDAIPLSDGRLLVSVGDVMGKGAAAAALMSQARTAVRAYGLEDPRPAAILRRLDRLVATFGETRLVTAVVAVVEPSTGEVVLASAGHPPPVVVGPGSCRVVGGGRLRILGVGSGADGGPGPEPEGAEDQTSVRLGPRDTLILYSDGLVERRGETITEGVARLCTVAADCLEAETWWQRAAGCLVDTLVGDEANDDVVVLTIATPDVPAGEADQRPPGVWSMALPSDPSSVPAARRWLRARLTSCAEGADLDPELVGRAELLVAELVTNVVLHARSDVSIGLCLAGSGLRVEVSDQSPVLPVARDFGREASTGRGLLLVERLATRWAVEQAPAGKVVWFELDRAGAQGDGDPGRWERGTGPVGTGPVGTGPVGTGPVGTGAGPVAARAGTGTDRVAAAGTGPAVSSGGGPRRTVSLRQVPARLALASAAYYDGLERELLLPSVRPRRGEADGDTAVGAALRLAAEVGPLVTEAMAPATARWQQAVADGEEVVELDLDVPMAAGRACRQVNTLLDEIEGWCRQGLLLAVPAPAPVARFRRWLLGQVTDQCAGRRVRPWVDDPVVTPPRAGG